MPIDELLRFKDLQRLNIVKSWPQLRYMQRHYGFPEGILLGENTRAWAASKVQQWLEARPSVSPLIRERAEKSVQARSARPRRGRSRTTKAAAGLVATT
jgi:predicted DNA-binding transcriptional regulator AlpA